MTDPFAVARAAIAAGDPLRLAAALGDLSAADRLRLVEDRLAAADVVALAALDDPAAPAPVRKAARKALHRLRSRGLTPPAPATRAAVLAADPDPPEDPAGFVGLDPPVALLLLEVHPRGEHALFVVVTDSRDRLVGGHLVVEPARKRIRELRREYVNDGRVPVVAVPPGHVVERLQRVLRQPASDLSPDAEPQRRALLRRFDALVAAIEPREHPAVELAPDEPPSAVLHRFASLTTEDLPVVLRDEHSRRLLQSLHALAHGAIVLPPAVHTEREREVFRRFAAECAEEPLRVPLAHRFLDKALVVHRDGDTDAARTWAASGALLLRRPDDPAVLDLLEEWIRKQVVPVAVGADGRPVEAEPPRPLAGSGLVLPGADPTPRSGGGLILP